MFFLIGVVTAVLGLLGPPSPFSVIEIAGTMIGVAIAAMFVGGPLGYAVGCVAASIFLVRKEPDDGEPAPAEPLVSQGGGGERPAQEQGENGRESGDEAGRLPQSWADEYAMSLLADAAAQAERRSQPDVEAADSQAWGYVRAVVVEEGASQQPPSLEAITAKKPWGAPFGLKSSQPAVSVPRRFSVGTMMILVTAFAVLLGVLKTAGVDPIIFAAIAFFIGGVGACQVLMFKGTDPRRASFYGGMIMSGVLAVVAALAAACFSWEAAIGCVFWGGILAFIFGGPLGLCRRLPGRRDLSGAERARRRRAAARGVGGTDPVSFRRMCPSPFGRGETFRACAYTFSGVGKRERLRGASGAAIGRSTNGASCRARLGCCSVRSALLSIWRTRSRVTEKILPTSSSV